MRLGQDIENELGGYELARPDTGAWEGNGLTLNIPPSPISKESSAPRRPPPLMLDIARPGSASPSEPPNRPLPPRPMSKLGASGNAVNGPRLPAPTRPPPLRPQAPLGMNPPTRPGTAASQGMDEKALPRIIGSTRRFSYGSLNSNRRPLKYGEGKYSHIELVPQPSDDPDDPLVSDHLFQNAACKPNRPSELGTLEEGAQLLVASVDGSDDWCDQDHFGDGECPACRVVRGVVHICHGPDRHPPDSLSRVWLCVPCRRESVRKETALSGLLAVGVYRYRMEYQCYQQLWPMLGR